MGYYKKHAGDYYRGDYYRGDLWDDILGGISGAAEQFGKGALGGAIGSVGKVLFGATPAGAAGGGIVGPRLLPPAMDATTPASSGALAPQLKGVGALPPLRLSSLPTTATAVRLPRQRPDAGEARIRRRMNVFNPRALRRALRREQGFLHAVRTFVQLHKPGHTVTLREKPTKKKGRAR